MDIVLQVVIEVRSILFSVDTSEKLAMHPKVLCTPHLGASTIEAQKRVAFEIAEQIVGASKGSSVIGLVSVHIYC